MCEYEVNLEEKVNFHFKIINNSERGDFTIYDKETILFLLKESVDAMKIVSPR